jgi:hypothetical protein
MFIKATFALYWAIFLEQSRVLVFAMLKQLLLASLSIH